jgi:hypothetical protein
MLGHGSAVDTRPVGQRSHGGRHLPHQAEALQIRLKITLVLIKLLGLDNADVSFVSLTPEPSHRARPITNGSQFLIERRFGYELACRALVSSGFREIEIGWDRLESVGHLAPILAHESRWYTWVY